MRFTAIIILTLAVLLLTACGGSTVAPTPTTATSLPASPQPRQTPPPPTTTPTAPSISTATPPPTAATCESGGSDHDPAPGGPYFHQVYRAHSGDGLDFAPENQLVLDHASVPDAVLMPDGSTLLYYVNGLTEQHGIWVATQSPEGAWGVIDCVRLDGEFNGNAVDPDVILLDDGRLRLFYYEGRFVGPRPLSGEEPPHPIYSAVSRDGVNFSVEARLLAVEGVTDPSVVRLPSGAWLMALSQGPRTLLAHSQDGNTFQLRGDPIKLGGVLELALSQGPRTLLAHSQDGNTFQLRGDPIKLGGVLELALLPGGRLRLYVSAMGIKSLISEDNGVTWTEEPGTRLSSRDGGILADPSLISSNGEWTMYYKIVPADGSAPQGPAQPPKPGSIQTAPAIRPAPQGPAQPPKPGFNANVTPLSGASETWQSLQIEGQSQSVATGGIADAEILVIPSGGYRLYAGEMSTHAIVSFLSDDGLTWRREEGARLPNGAFPDAVPLPDGRVRLYYQGAGVINSAISSDGGFTFTQEPGTRVAPGWHGDLDVSQVGAPTTVALPQGGFRMYYRGGREDDTFFNRINTVILSAVSTDGLTWRPEDGVRPDPADFVSPGTPDTARFLDGPEALLTENGVVKLYFWGVSVCDGVCRATSDDGLTFQQVEQVFPTDSTPFRVNPGDPTVLPRPDGPCLMYFGNGSLDDHGIWVAQRD